MSSVEPGTVLVVADFDPITPRPANFDAESGLGMSAPLGTTAMANTMPLFVNRRLRKSVTLSMNDPVV